MGKSWGSRLLYSDGHVLLIDKIKIEKCFFIPRQKFKVTGLVGIVYKVTRYQNSAPTTFFVRTTNHYPLK